LLTRYIINGGACGGAKVCATIKPFAILIVYINRKVSHISMEKYTGQQQEWIASVHKK